MPRTVTVSIPPDPALLHVLRRLTVGVAATLRLTIDDVDDLQLAVDEAASVLLTQLPSSSAIMLTLDPDDTSLRAAVTSDARSDGWPAPGLLDSLTWKVIAGLVDEAAAEADPNDRPSIVLVKRTIVQTDGR